MNSQLSILPPIPRLAPSRLSELSSLLTTLHLAAARASSTNPALARAYRLQSAAVQREQASWRSALSAVRARTFSAVALLILAEATACVGFVFIAVFLGMAAVFLAWGAVCAGGRMVQPWQRDYAQVAKVGKARRGMSESQVAG